MKLRGAWRRDYSEFFDTQEALLIDAMDNADSIYTVFARLQSLAVKCGCAGKLLLHESVPYTDEMLAAVTKKTVPAFRQCVQPLVQLGLGTYGHLYPNTNQAVAKKLTGILNYSEPKTSIANYTSNQHTADYHRA